MLDGGYPSASAHQPHQNQQQPDHRKRRENHCKYWAKCAHVSHELSERLTARLHTNGVVARVGLFEVNALSVLVRYGRFGTVRVCMASRGMVWEGGAWQGMAGIVRQSHRVLRVSVLYLP